MPETNGESCAEDCGGLKTASSSFPPFNISSSCQAQAFLSSPKYSGATVAMRLSYTLFTGAAQRGLLRRHTYNLYTAYRYMPTAISSSHFPSIATPRVRRRSLEFAPSLRPLCVLNFQPFGSSSFLVQSTTCFLFF